MQLWVTCSGVVIGSADFKPPEGLAWARLIRSDGFTIAALAVEELWRDLADIHYWPAIYGDFASEVAQRWPGGRLALQDFSGEELSVNNLVVFGGNVVADFRPDLARVEAFLKTVGPGGGRSRPAA